MKSTCFACLLVLLGSFGCNSAEAPSEVSGTVTMDGVPLAEGEIIFEASDNSKTPSAGMIKDGKYTAQVLPGSKKVKISASRPTVSRIAYANGGKEILTTGDDNKFVRWDAETGKELASYGSHPNATNR